MKHDDENPVKLPDIPDRKYFTIREAGILCAVKPYVLRYWEQEFTQLKPVKRRGRRYYQLKDILLIRRIKKLLYQDGFTIEGARSQLSNNSEPIVPSNHLQTIITELECLLSNFRQI